MTTEHRIGIIGAGGWGTALASILAENGHSPLLWTKDKETADEINTLHTNSVFLPNIILSKEILATTDSSAINGCETIIITVPTQFIREVLKTHGFQLSGKYIVNGSKGIERGTLRTVSSILHDVNQCDAMHYAVLSGPSHAEETVRRVPTTVMVASANQELAQHVQSLFNNQYFRVYTSGDTIGAEIGGSLKNVIAIAAGIVDGLGTGDNTKAALITRGLEEIARLGMAMGANPRTFAGLSGLGDLYVTCSSRHSRNRHVGEQIAKGKHLSEILEEMTMIAEGVTTAESAWELSKKHHVDMPIVEQMYLILFHQKDPAQAITDLMIRASKAETHQ
ncbi:MAG: NAD(P)H-dependent glycerol-3-phosphate dehydrogenase [Candidatus Kapaibacteriota bacterium]|jgi:glycerol-3-phosphate dehydrogenase (NAD(P)+)